jgi:hypothetical protein
MKHNKKSFLAIFGHEDHIKSLIDDNDVSHFIASRKDLTDEQVDKLSNSNDYLTKFVIAQNPLIKENHYDRLSSDPDRDIRGALTRNPKISDENLRKLSNDPEFIVSKRAKVTLERRASGDTLK